MCDSTRSNSFNATSPRCELDSVREKIPDDLLETRVVTGDRPGFRIQLCLKAHSLCIGSRTNDLDRVLDDGNRFDRSDVESHPAGDDPRDVEYVLNKLSLMLRVSLDGFVSV